MERKEQLINLVSGNISSGEKEKLLDEIKKDSQLKKEYEAIKNRWSLISANQYMDDVTIERSYLSFSRKKDKNIQGRALLLNVLKYAAIVILVFTIGIFSRQIFTGNQDKNLIGSVENNEIHVPNGEKAELKLSDGSKVWLNNGTTIRFPRTFGRKTRRVNLYGEAFFDVIKNAVPFIVSSDFGEIEVLGTTFNVRAYNNLKPEITLVEGRIQFKDSAGEKILGPGQQMTLTDNEDWIIKHVDPKIATSWKEGTISFENEELVDVAKKMERHFNIHIDLDPKIALISFTGQIFNESVGEVMEYINKTKPICYAYDRKTGILKIKSKE